MVSYLEAPGLGWSPGYAGDLLQCHHLLLHPPLQFHWSGYCFAAAAAEVLLAVDVDSAAVDSR